MDSNILLLGLLGIASSIATEVINGINAKLNNTVLKGDGAFILAAAVAFVIAGIQAAFTVGINFTNPGAFLSSVATYGSQVWAVSQIFFVGIYQKLGLDLNSGSNNEAPAKPSNTPANG